uniref:U12-lycotoxin-Ls1e n=1 Tax=Lycosa singoriensis TaxID=434756 RepID=TXC06_LYCSI|nr:RecName: Full=U12-lycotoxin-Ls1e; AltName: Full=Toxin-like structure LSTX-K6; Flags: Precursor [Lycosa singoriensis]ACI41434.1 toxin-like structure LSTX-K6 precursor [Lycosa singoriensis]CAS03703.1 toxin-like structure LSTX-K6 precursor [Lycosa singoriensis]
MKFAVILLFTLVVLAVASESVEEDTREIDVEEFQEQQRGCADLRQPCTKGDDCSCCGSDGVCNCEHLHKTGCFCKTAGPYEKLKKWFKRCPKY